MRAYIDSDVLIWYLRGERKALSYLRNLRDSREYEFWISAMQRAETVFFMRPEEEADTMFFLSQFKTSPVDQRVVDEAGELYRKWNPSYGMDINDALLAATAKLNGGHIFCLNTKHYPLSEIIIKKAW